MLILIMKLLKQKYIHNCKTIKKAWQHLKKVYHEKKMHWLIFLMKKLIYAKLLLKKNKAMKKYIHEII